MTKFQEWWQETGSHPYGDCENCVKAWNAAIEAAAKSCDMNHEAYNHGRVTERLAILQCRDDILLLKEPTE